MNKQIIQKILKNINKISILTNKNMKNKKYIKNKEKTSKISKTLF